MSYTQARSDEISPTNSLNTFNVDVNVTPINLNPLSDLSTSQPEDNEFIGNNIGALRIDERPITDLADNSESRLKCPDLSSNKRVVVIRKVPAGTKPEATSVKEDSKNRRQSNVKNKHSESKRCKSCGKEHNSSKCKFNKSLNKSALLKHINMAKYYQPSTPQSQKPKVSLETHDDDDSDTPDDDPIFVIDWVDEWEHQVTFEYVEENHSLSFLTKVSNWWHSRPNIQYDSLPRSLMLLCDESLGLSRGTIHFVTYSSKVFESELWRQWSMYLMDNDMLIERSELKRSIIHYFFHDMRSFEKLLPTFRANEGYSASLNLARPILDSRSLFTNYHTPWLFFRRVFSKLYSIGVFGINLAYFFKMYTELRLLLSVIRLNKRDIAINVVLNLVVLYFLNKTAEYFRSKISDDSAEKVLTNRQYDMSQLTICTTFPKASLFVEEVVKSIPGGWFLVGVIERIKYGTWKNYEWHKKSMKHNFQTRISKHLKKNKKLAMQNTGEWLDDINRSVDHDFPVVRLGHTESYEHEVMIRPARYPKIDELVPYENNILKKHNGQLFAGTQRIHATILDHNEYEGYYPIMYHVGNFKKPAPSFDNLLGAWHKRAVDIPNSTLSVTANAYLLAILDGMHRSHIDMNDTTRQSWFEKLRPIQKHRIMTVKDYEALGVRDKTISVSVKSDELLCTTEKMVPRLIFNVSGYWFDRIGTFATELSHNVAKLYNAHHENPINYRGIIFYPYFTCGATSKSLNKFYKDSVGVEGYHLMVMGDDLHVYDGYHQRFVENDFSKYDRSQNYHLQDLFIEWLNINGFGDVADIMLDMRDAKLQPKCRKINPIKIPTYPFPHPKHMEMMFTGQPFTCLQNSIINILTTIYVLSSSHNYQTLNYMVEPELKERYTKRYKVCGLTAKVLIPQINRSTFLKGVFLDGIWVRLPSFLCKFGKVMTRPSTICKQPNAIAQILWAQWLGYGEMKTNWFYRTLHSLFLQICMRNGFRSSNEELDTSIKAIISKDMEYSMVADSKEFVCDTTFNSFMLARYNISVDQMNAYCDYLRKDHRLPMIYSHELILALEGDY